MIFFLIDLREIEVKSVVRLDGMRDRVPSILVVCFATIDASLMQMDCDCDDAEMKRMKVA